MTISNFQLIIELQQSISITYNYLYIIYLYLQKQHHYPLATAVPNSCNIIKLKNLLLSTF